MSSVVLVGMPGVGKSTVGVLLAKELALDFVDTDLLIQRREKKTLQEIIDKSNYLALRKIEEQVILENTFVDTVVATGGSAVYGAKAMEKLRSAGAVVYLSCARSELEARIHNWEMRGIACPPGQDIAALLTERHQLYQQYADHEINTNGLTPAEVVKQLVSALPFKSTKDGGQDDH